MSDNIRPLVYGGHVISVPVSDEVRRVMEKHLQKHTAELDESLEPYGLSSTDIVMPSFERVIPSDLEPDYPRWLDAALDNATAKLRGEG